MAKSLVLLTVISMLSKLLGFMREILLAYFYGTSGITDIFLMAVSCSSIFLGCFTALAVVHTPVYQEIAFRKSEKLAEQYTNQMNLAIFVLGLIGTAIIYVWGTDMVHTVAQGFSEEKVRLTVEFFRWAAFSVVLSSISQICISELNCKGKFSAANATNCILSFVQIVFILLSGIFHNFTVLKYSTLAAAAAQLVFLAAILANANHGFWIRLPIMKELKHTFVLVAPIFISTLMDEINAFVDKMFGSGLTEGSIAALNYAHLIKQLFFHIFATAMVTILYPKLSESLVKKDMEGFHAYVNIGMEYMIILFSIIMAILVAFAEPIVEIIYKRGNFGNAAVEATEQALTMYAMALLPLAVREMLIRIFQARKDTKINMIVGGLSTALNVILNCVLVTPLGHMGLALSTALSAYFTVPALFYYLHKKKVEIQMQKILGLLAKAVPASILASGVFRLLFLSYIIQMQNMWLKILSLGSAAAGICALYFIGLWVLQVESVRAAVWKIKEKLK